MAGAGAAGAGAGVVRRDAVHPRDYAMQKASDPEIFRRAATDDRVNANLVKLVGADRVMLAGDNARRLLRL